jgi:hypothetical protein
MQLTLIPHPATPPTEPLKLWANVEYIGSLGAVATTNIWFGIGAPAHRFVIPPPVESDRADELWRTTCLEAFLQADGEAAYTEWNFAPSGQWAAYTFSDYRTDMAPAEIGSPPYIRFEDNLTWWALGATIAVPADAGWNLGLSAVLEETGGTKSYWALSHVQDKPDFHDPGCFAARLP